jgi:tRNA modification GTPase
MQLLRQITDTIVAPATPLSRGALSVVRLSGPLSSSILQKITQKMIFTPRNMILSDIFDVSGQVIDTALVVYFKGPQSLTGEDVVEIQCHGNPLIVQSIQDLCCAYGARLAGPGEFLERAYVNNKYDLSQVEAINALINARTTQALKYSMQIAQGKIGEKVALLSQKVVAIRVLLESSIDFSDEPDIDDYLVGQAEQQLAELIQHTQEAVIQADRSLAVHTGLKVALIGPPNAGKSSLINAFAGSEVAIVDDQAGTTRDLIKHDLSLGGIPLSLVDTAGLRETTNSIENRGIAKAKKEALEAEIVIYLNTAGATISNEHQSFLKTLSAKRLLLNNKIDLDYEKNDIPEDLFDKVFYISLKTNEGWETFNEAFKNWILGQYHEENFTIVSKRQLNVLKEFLEILSESRDNKKAELMAESLYQAQQALNKITQEQLTQDDLLGKIFSTFCIGK